jgi:hypothetical protein
MNRTSFNFAMDTIAFVGFVLLTATGVLMHYLLPPGSGHFTTIWGLDRHDWGQVHFWISAVFLAILALHLCLHWRWVIALVRGRPHQGDTQARVRIALGLVGLIALLALALAPFLSPIETSSHGPGRAGVEKHLGTSSSAR